VRRVPRSQLDREFVRAVRASGRSLVTLAALSDFPAYTQLSALLNTEQARVTGLNIARLRALAEAVQVDGPLFEVRHV
jgi:hypothetical protein